MSFPLVGNVKTRSTVLSLIAANRLPHALLITGDNGLGKHTLARFIAKAAVCSESVKPCGSCKNCVTAGKDMHPDIIYVRREKDKKELGVKVIRQLRSDAFVVPHEADRKVFIIEDAQNMNISAQNALLKILEEPPESVLFILLCTVPSAILPTVLSRCITVCLLPVGEDEGAKEVCRITGCKEADALEAVKNTRGNIGKAILLLKNGAHNTAKVAAEEFLNMLCQKNEYGMLKALSVFEKDRAGTDLFFDELKAEICEKIKTLPPSGKRARALYNLFCSLDEFKESAKLNANLSLLFCTLTAAAGDYMR